MGTMLLRHYEVTVGYCNLPYERRIRAAQKKMRIKLSRRRFKQGVRTALHTIKLV